MRQHEFDFYSNVTVSSHRLKVFFKDPLEQRAATAWVGRPYRRASPPFQATEIDFNNKAGKKKKFGSEKVRFGRYKNTRGLKSM